MEMYNVRSIADAKQILNTEFQHQLGWEIVHTAEAVGRHCFGEVVSGEDIPGFARSTVDGYAVRSKDVFGASESMPAMLQLVGEVIMGQQPIGTLEVPGQTMYVPTGGMLPVGADCVVMMEYSSRLGEDMIMLEKPAAPLENVIRADEDMKNGEVALASGVCLRPYEIGVLSSLGINEVKVYKHPVIGIISTGDEVVSPELQPLPGQVRDINTNLLYAAVQAAGAVPRSYGIINDEFDLLKQAVDTALRECDLVLVSGGSSVGKKDQTLKVINSFVDGGVLVHGLAVKPGKPTIIGRGQGKVIFGLPGHPLACSIIFTILVQDYVRGLYGHTEQPLGTSAVFGMNYHKAKGREEYLPVQLERTTQGIVAMPVFGKSGLITSFAKAYGYVAIDRNKEGLLAGEQIEVFRF